MGEKNSLDASLLERLVDAVERISTHGISVYLKCDDSDSSNKMALDLAAMRISDAIDDVASALDSIYKVI